VSVWASLAGPGLIPERLSVCKPAFSLRVTSASGFSVGGWLTGLMVTANVRETMLLLAPPSLTLTVMTAEPYASARRVFWVADNGSSHAGRASAARMQQAYPNATLVHLPVHASWLNQVEVVFSVIQRKVIRPADFSGSDVLAARLLAFQERYNATATPFDWKFTRAKLNDLVRRIDARRGSVTLAA